MDEVSILGSLNLSACVYPPISWDELYRGSYADPYLHPLFGRQPTMMVATGGSLFFKFEVHSLYKSLNFALVRCLASTRPCSARIRPGLCVIKSRLLISASLAASRTPVPILYVTFLNFTFPPDILSWECYGLLTPMGKHVSICSIHHDVEV